MCSLNAIKDLIAALHIRRHHITNYIGARTISFEELTCSGTKTVSIMFSKSP